MFNFLLLLLNSLFKRLFSNRKDLILTLIILKKENQIYKRQFNQKQIQDLMRKSDRLLFIIISAISKRAVRHLTIINPSTLLDWQRRFIKNFWSYKHKTPGRKPVSSKIKNIILEMKQNNPLWGCHRIADELKKIGIELHPTTINKIIQTFRKQGKIQPNGSWSEFLKSHWNSLFGMDFMVIDTIFGKRLYLFIIMKLKTRQIIRYDLTQNPCREFVKQRIELFSDEYQDQQRTLIYDNATQFTSIDYSWYDIEGVNICPYAPNMNAYVERFVSENCVVTIQYTLKDNEGNLLDTTGDTPLSYLHGAKNLISGLERELTDKSVGDNIKGFIPPQEAYGEIKPELIQVVSKEMFPGIDKIEPGMQFESRGAGNQPIPVRIEKVDGDQVTINRNHPLAGLTLNFEIEVVDIREATEEEIAHGHPHE